MLWQFEDSTCPTISPLAICRANQRRPAFIRHRYMSHKTKNYPSFSQKKFQFKPSFEDPNSPGFQPFGLDPDFFFTRTAS